MKNKQTSLSRAMRKYDEYRPMLTFTTAEFVREQYFLASNVQAVKLIANRRIYGCGFRTTCLVRISSNKNICDRQTDWRMYVEKERERERQEVRKVDVFFTRFVANCSGQFRATSYAENVKRFSITIAVTTPTEKTISGDNWILLDVGAVLRFRIEDHISIIFPAVNPFRRIKFIVIQIIVLILSRYIIFITFLCYNKS